MLFLRPEVIQGAILFRAMVPFIPDPLPNLSSKKRTIICWIRRSIVSRNETENLYRLFQKTNAIITLKWQPSSHNLIQEDIVVAKPWISNNFPA